jgi:hypothetical protein
MFVFVFLDLSERDCSPQAVVLMLFSFYEPAVFCAGPYGLR